MVALCCLLLLGFDSSSGAFLFALVVCCGWVEATGGPNAWWERRNGCPKEIQAEWLCSLLSFKGCVYCLEQAAAICFWHLLPFLPEVTRILLFAAQASHQLVPPEVSVLPMMDIKWAAGHHGNATESVWGEANWSDGVEKLVAIAAIFASSEALFHKGRGEDVCFIFCKKMCLENTCGLS